MFFKCYIVIAVGVVGNPDSWHVDSNMFSGCAREDSEREFLPAGGTRGSGPIQCGLSIQ